MTTQATATDSVRLSVNLSPEVAAALRSIAEGNKISVTEAVRRAISSQKFIEDTLNKGGAIFVKYPTDDHYREVIFVR